MNLSKKLLTLIVFSYILIFCFSNLNSENNLVNLIEFDGEKSSRIPVLIAKVNNGFNNLDKIVSKISKNLALSGQFEVIINNHNFPQKKSEFKSLADAGFYLVIFISESKNVDNNSFIEFRIYDSINCNMLKGLKIENSDDIADIISDHIWQNLTAEPGIFQSQIAYSKRISNNRSNHQSVICLNNIIGSLEKVIIKTHTVNIKPQFAKVGSNLKLFYSEFTAANVRLMSYDFNKNLKKPVFDLDGTLVGISCDSSGAKAAYCRSGDIWIYSYDQELKKSIHKKLIYNFGNANCPNLLPNGDIIFASDFGGNSSSIYILKNSHNSLVPQKLNISGYCVAPAYCAKNNKIVYSKKLDGFMQLFTYNLHTNHEEQLTYKSGNKIDACWSPCGNYVLFCYQEKDISRIARLHVNIKEIVFVTPISDFCGYPAWS